MRGIILAILLAASGFSFVTPAMASALAEFTSQTAAQQHCPADTVVWLNTKSGIYHYQGSRYYGETEYGAYVCEKEALGAGMRASKNGS